MTLNTGIKDKDAARAALKSICAVHGSQTRLAAACNVPLPYINRIIKQGGMPSLLLRVALERECGIPFDAWDVERWTFGKAADVLRVQLKLQPDGQPEFYALRMGLAATDLDDLLAGTTEVPDRVRAYCWQSWGVPEGAWDVEHPSGGPARSMAASGADASQPADRVQHCNTGETLR